MANVKIPDLRLKFMHMAEANGNNPSEAVDLIHGLDPDMGSVRTLENYLLERGDKVDSLNAKQESAVCHFFQFEPGLAGWRRETDGVGALDTFVENFEAQGVAGDDPVTSSIGVQRSPLASIELEASQGSSDERPILLFLTFGEDGELVEHECGTGQREVFVGLSGCVIAVEFSEGLEAKRESLLGFGGKGFAIETGVRMRVLSLGNPIFWEIVSETPDRPITVNLRTLEQYFFVASGATTGGAITGRILTCAKLCRIVPVPGQIETSKSELSAVQRAILGVLERKPYFPRGRNDRVVDSFPLKIEPASPEKEVDQ